MANRTNSAATEMRGCASLREREFAKEQEML